MAKRRVSGGFDGGRFLVVHFISRLVAKHNHRLAGDVDVGKIIVIGLLGRNAVAREGQRQVELAVPADRQGSVILAQDKFDSTRFTVLFFGRTDQDQMIVGRSKFRVDADFEFLKRPAFPDVGPHAIAIELPQADRQYNLPLSRFLSSPIRGLRATRRTQGSGRPSANRCSAAASFQSAEGHHDGPRFARRDQILTNEHQQENQGRYKVCGGPHKGRSHLPDGLLDCSIVTYPGERSQTSLRRNVLLTLRREEWITAERMNYRGTYLLRFRMSCACRRNLTTCRK